ncbi:MAG: tripartite tricarboxylate transporter TctB family protein [Rhodobacteraceae bacterium]|nr:tripartite tricarboxylate transporter TctB family protein [Paracoccaceae bacterium]
MDPIEGEREGANEKTVSTRTMDVIVAALFMALSVLVMWDSWRIGAGWASDGPEAGYFPFYVALIMFLSSAVTFVTNIVARTRDWSNFVDRSQLKLVLKVLVPTMIYVVLIGYLGIYVASAIFIAFFMAWLGRYPIQKVLPVAVLVPLLLFMMFEVWFLVPLPKGPLEAALGY